MFSDTHFHFKLMTEEWGINGVDVLFQMAQRNCFFGLDIGTKADDLLIRQNSLEKSVAQIKDHNLANKVRDFVYFSAGIWPDIESIHNRDECMKILKNSINNSELNSDQDILHRKIIAIGEGGLDHHWNPSGTDGRCESDFDKKTFYGESELFKMQLELAKEMNLPFIVHSRDAFEDTLNCIKEVGYNKGVIHCYSYGFEEVKSFLDLGWYISFSGSVTYTKKSKMEEMINMIKYIPSDRLLCETDSPYLAPVPKRGNPNCPLFVEHTYNFVANARSVSSETISEIVDENIKTLFFNK